MRVILLRHAQTAGNMLSQYIGVTDQSLSPEGEALARRIGPDAAVKRVYASRLRRSLETAAILYPGADIVIRDDLAEMNFGAFEGKSWRDLENDPRYASWLQSECEMRCPGGEDKAGFNARCRTAFLQALAAEEAAGADVMHMVIHRGVIMSIMSGFVVADRSFFEWRPGHCGGFVIERKAGEALFSLIRSIEPPGGGAAE